MFSPIVRKESNIWKVGKGCDLFRNHVRWVPRSGRNIRLWEDNWTGLGSLQHLSLRDLLVGTPVALNLRMFGKSMKGGTLKTLGCIYLPV